MRILGWNCWSICNASTARALRALIRVHNADCIFLCETKATKDRMMKLALSIGFSEQIMIGAKGKAGGICLLWSISQNVEIIEFDSWTIAVTVREEYCTWDLIGFYRTPVSSKAWENLNALIQSLHNPWMCFEDFNVVVEDSEKEGRTRGNTSAPNFLKELLFNLGAVDLGHSRNKFT